MKDIISRKYYRYISTLIYGVWNSNKMKLCKNVSRWFGKLRGRALMKYLKICNENDLSFKFHTHEAIRKGPLESW